MERWRFDRSDLEVGQGRRSGCTKANICRESMIILVHAVVGCVLFARSIKRRLYRRNCLDVIPWSITKTRPGTSEEGFAPLKFSRCRVPGNVIALLPVITRWKVRLSEIDNHISQNWLKYWRFLKRWARSFCALNFRSSNLFSSKILTKLRRRWLGPSEVRVSEVPL